MQPQQIELMLHVATISEPIPDADSVGSSVWSDMRLLLEAELIRVDQSRGSGYTTTKRGEAYVQFLLEMPLPVCNWVIPLGKGWEGSV